MSLDRAHQFLPAEGSGVTEFWEVTFVLRMPDPKMMRGDRVVALKRWLAFCVDRIDGLPRTVDLAWFEGLGEPARLCLLKAFQEVTLREIP